MIVKQELKTVVLHLWEVKKQKIKMVMLGGTTVSMEVKRLSMRMRRRKKRKQMMKVQREVRYQINMKRSLIKLNHYSN